MLHKIYVHTGTLHCHFVYANICLFVHKNNSIHTSTLTEHRKYSLPSSWQSIQAAMKIMKSDLCMVPVVLDNNGVHGIYDTAVAAGERIVELTLFII